MSEEKIATFKGFDKNLQCREFQFQIGETALLNNRESCCFDMPILVKDACNSCVILPILTLTY